MKKAILGAGVILAVAMLSACGSSSKKIEIPTNYTGYEKYTEYLTKVEGSDDDLEVSSEWTDNKTVYIDNNSDYFVMTTLEMSDKMINGETVFSGDTALIRPHGYTWTDENDEDGEYFNFKNTSFYDLTYDCPVEYDWMYDGITETQEETISIIKSGSYTTEDLEAIAKKEYVIGVLGNSYYNLYFYDDTITYDQDPDYSDYPDLASCVYSAKMDYDAKTISIYEGSDMSGTAISTVTMD